MNETLTFSSHALWLGVLATALLDLWMLLLKWLKIPILDMALMGRWFGHLLKGRPTRGPIATAPPVRAERALGWTMHYAIGIAFAAMFIAVVGDKWMRAPTAMPALIFGIATVAAPFFIMQPAMGAGIASSRTRTPLFNIIKSIANHAVFGGGLYLAAQLLQPLS
jgi:Protein of unknown function (DUF2938)